MTPFTLPHRFPLNVLLAISQVLFKILYFFFIWKIKLYFYLKLKSTKMKLSKFWPDFGDSNLKMLFHYLTNFRLTTAAIPFRMLTAFSSTLLILLCLSFSEVLISWPVVNKGNNVTSSSCHSILVTKILWVTIYYFLTQKNIGM